jgi:Uma2 family endonuclease
MSTISSCLPVLGTMAGFRRFTVPEYHRLIEIGVLTEDDNLELLEGYLVHKMSRNPPHDGMLNRVFRRLLPLLTVGWDARMQCAVTLSDSEPEPDLAIVRLDAAGYTTRHPGPSDVGLIIEMANLTLAGDRADKRRIYGRAGIATYWIVNLVDRQIEVYTDPTGPDPDPTYRRRQDHLPGDSVDFTLAETHVASIPVVDLLP